MDEQAWREQRLKGVGASEVASILGLNPWKSAFDVWAEKTRRVDPYKGNVITKWGNRLENAIAEGYGDDSGDKVVDLGPYQTVQHASIPMLFATPDRTIEITEDSKPDKYGNLFEGDGVGEFKNTGEFHREEWEDGGPPMYLIQLQVQLMCTEMNHGTLAGLVGGNKLRWYRYAADQEIHDTIAEKVEQFWWHVENNQPPDVPEGQFTHEMYQKLHPKDNGETITLCDEALEWSDRLVIIGEQKKQLAAEEKDLRKKLMAELGDNTFGHIPGDPHWMWKWAVQKKAGYEVESKESRVLRKVKKK